ncbi:outer membrane receptor protein involved in Fe transport [Sphingomonas naasensis]|uniref:TonB-dependent receptor n=1 Tax=Sphingomonas naasensis TaxID=1344951 RepID=A0A4V3QWP6_9SPHN|nr:TonB-dependent receptor [Sphingomonas naasensis]NIJ21045.1 outer membrane receptor protein involved in Fe transport [Sphingomonas naasensis]TGX43422.1 TonB-dependent receptor [Sphingomonas naasensis]
MTHLKNRTSLLITAAAVALLAPVAARAQDGADAPQAPVASEGEVVVTAQKREENIQDVPISISVVGGPQMQQSGGSQLTDYAAYVPGLQVDNNGSPGRSTLSLRGVAPIGPSATVGVYLDDAPIGSSGIYNRAQSFSLDLLPYDIERLEVLRGPQGTLYGASSIGGLLKYVTVQPDLQRLSVRASGEAFTVAHGDDMGWAASAMVNIPIVSDTLAVSGSYSRRETPGYIDNILTGEKDVNDAVQQGGRVALLWRPDTNLTVKLSGLWQSVDSDNFGIVYEGMNNTPLAPGAAFLSTNAQLAEPFTSDFQFYSGTIAYDFGFAELSSTTSYSELKILETSDASRVYGVIWGGLAIYPANLHQKKWTEEVRLTSASSDRFEWMLGFFYTDEDNSHDQVVRALDASGAILPAFDPFAIVALPNTYKEYAVFGNATWKFSDAFHVTGGLRWARNDQTFTQLTQIPLIGLDTNGDGSSSEEIVTWSVSPQLFLGQDTMLYARAATGYRPGGPNIALPGFPATVDSETVTSYEVGLKAQLLDRAVTFNAAAFLLDWNDLQTSEAFANGINGLVNAGTARSKGFEASLLLQPIAGFSVGGNIAYTDARCTETTANCTDGDRLPNVPELAAAMTADYSFAVGNSAKAHVGGAVRIVGDRISAVESSPLNVPVDGYATLDLNASVTFGEKWTLRAYARNLTDERGRITSNVATVNPGFLSTVPLQPRTLGVALDLAF